MCMYKSIQFCCVFCTVAVAVCTSENVALHKGYISARDKQEMELSTFYSDCSVYDDSNLFGGEICGTDGNTYANVVYLSCLNHWEPENQSKLFLCVSYSKHTNTHIYTHTYINAYIH